MKRHWVCLQLRFEDPKDVKLEMISRRAALSGNTSLWLPPSLVCLCRPSQCDLCRTAKCISFHYIFHLLTFLIISVFTRNSSDIQLPETCSGPIMCQQMQLRCLNHALVSCGRKIFFVIVFAPECLIMFGVCDVAEAVATRKGRFLKRFVLYKQQYSLRDMCYL